MSRALRSAVGAVLLVVVVGAPVRAHAQSEPYGVKVESDLSNQLSASLVTAPRGW